MNKIDISNLLKEYAKKYKKEFQGFLVKRIGIDGKSYSSLKRRSDGRWRPKGHRNSNTRLYDTGELRDNAFKTFSDDTSLTIEINGRHSTGRSYADIIAYNSVGSGQTNIYVKDAPMVFPIGQGQKLDFNRMELTREFYADLQKLIEIQGQGILKEADFPKTITLG